MKARHFIKQLRTDEIVAAIRRAEKQTSGELRVFISRKPVHAPVGEAQRHFLEAGMDKTRERNAVLIFIAPRTRRFAIIGDTGVHAKCGDDFWIQLSAEMTEHFKKGEFTAGITHGLAKAAELLAGHFPRRDDDRNELPDDVLSD